jgi:hypothetical protein
MNKMLLHIVDFVRLHVRFFLSESLTRSDAIFMAGKLA